MEVVLKELENATIVMVSGRVESSTSPQFDEVVQGLQDRENYRIILDMSQLEYMSSAGLRALLSAQKRVVREKKGEILFVRVPENIRNVMELAGLVGVFKIYDDEASIPELSDQGSAGDPATGPIHS